MIPMMTAAGWLKRPSDIEPFLRLDPTVLSAVTLGSYTPEPREGNPGQNFWTSETDLTSINSLGLPNPGRIGLDFLTEMVPRIKRNGMKVRVSIAGFSVNDYELMVHHLSNVGIDEIELNFGCPNVVHEGKQKPIFAFDIALMQSILFKCHGMRSETSASFAVKVSPYSNPVELENVARMLGGYANLIRAIVVSNTFPNALAFDENGKETITANNGFGGLSGDAMHHIALGQVRQFRTFLPNMPIIGVGGISRLQHVLNFKRAGATEVQIGTACFLNGPTTFQNIVEEYAGVGK